jgi:hypothetical protein
MPNHAFYCNIQPCPLFDKLKIDINQEKGKFHALPPLELVVFEFKVVRYFIIQSNGG